MPSVGFPLKIGDFDLFVYKIKKFVVILSETAYNELEVANLQTAVVRHVQKLIFRNFSNFIGRQCLIRFPIFIGLKN
jgi:hypothetical protein